MKHLDRLIIKAKKVCGTTELRFSLGMVYPVDDGKWEACGQLWNYIPRNKPGSELTVAKCICDSVEDAVEALNELGEKYPNDRDVTIIIDDIPEKDDEYMEGVKIDHIGGATNGKTQFET